MIVEKTKLKSALSKLSVLVGRESTVDGNPTRILFDADGGHVSLTSCDGSNLGVFSFTIADQSTLSFVCDYRTLASATVLRGDVQMDVEDSVLTITQGDTKMRYPVKGKDSYPNEAKSIESDDVLTVGSSKLKKLLSKISYIRKEKDPRMFTTGINFILKGNELKMETTDGPRIFRNFTTLEQDAGFSFKGLLGSRAVRLIESLDDEIDVAIQMDDNAISFETGDMKVYTPLLNCKFPTLDKLFTIDEKSRVKLNKSEVLESMEIFAVSDNKALTLAVDGDKMLFYMNDGISEIKDKIPMINSSGTNFGFPIDFDFFRDLFKNLKDCETVEIVCDDDMSPVYFCDEENMEGMLMPLKK